jgi:hypothetical protein
MSTPKKEESNNMPQNDIDSSIESAADAIKKEKEEKEAALKAIFADNKSKRYGPAIDA